MIVAVIPARGGSKRIPRKNIKPFCGKPMIAWPIAAALASGCFDRIIVSTDDEEIAAVAREHGAEAPFVRPAKLADDFTGTSAVVCHALRWLADQGTPAELVCCLYATAIFVRPEDLRSGLELLQRAPEKQYAFTLTTFASPVQRAMRMTPEGGLEPVQPECVPKRSQDLEEIYHDAGQFYWGRAQAYLDGVRVYSKQSIPIILPRYRVQDIDTPEDWVMAEYLFRATQMLETENGASRHSN